MPKDDDLNKPNESADALVILGQINRIETAALVCDVLLLCVFVVDQVFFSLNMWLLILLLLIIGLYLFLFGLFPERYIFTPEALEIRNLIYKSGSIPYNDVFNLEITRRDRLINLVQQNKIKVYYYTTGNNKKLVICRPRDVDSFSEEMRKRCPEFDDDWQESSLNVFFK